MKVLYFNRIDVSEGINVNVTSASKEYIICQNWYFLDKEFKFRSGVCNGCRDIIMMSMNLSDIGILRIEGVDYCCIINGISQSEAIALLNNTDLNEKSGTLWNIKIYYHV